MLSAKAGQSWSRLRGPSLHGMAAELAARGFVRPSGRNYFSLCRRFDAHRVTAGRAALRKFPTFERPPTKLLPFAKI
jgi:hypothetical protein